MRRFASAGNGIRNARPPPLPSWVFEGHALVERLVKSELGTKPMHREVSTPVGRMRCGTRVSEVYGGDLAKKMNDNAGKHDSVAEICETAEP